MSSALPTPSTAATFTRKSAHEAKINNIQARASRPSHVPRRFSPPQSSLRYIVDFEVIDLTDEDEGANAAATLAPATIASTSKPLTTDERFQEECWIRTAHKQKKDLWTVARHEARLLAWQQDMATQLEAAYVAYEGYLDPVQINSDFTQVLTCIENLEKLRDAHRTAVESQSAKERVLCQIDESKAYLKFIFRHPPPSFRILPSQMLLPTKKQWRHFGPAYSWSYMSYIEANGMPSHQQALNDLELQDNMGSLHNLYLGLAQQEFLSEENEDEASSGGTSEGEDTGLSVSGPSTPGSESVGLELSDDEVYVPLEQWSGGEGVEEEASEDCDDYVPFIMDFENRDEEGDEESEEVTGFGDEIFWIGYD